MTTVTETPMIQKFKQVYADATGPDMTEEQWEKAANERQLQWKGDRVLLAEAAEAYALIIRYNEFRSCMLTELHKAYPDSGIEVTPTRAYSVGVYLHIPDSGILRQEVEKWVNSKWKADEVEWIDGGNTLYVWWD